MAFFFFYHLTIRQGGHCPLDSTQAELFFLPAKKKSFENMNRNEKRRKKSGQKFAFLKLFSVFFFEQKNILFFVLIKLKRNHIKVQIQTNFL
jgi:hypothetical protein